MDIQTKWQTDVGDDNTHLAFGSTGKKHSNLSGASESKYWSRNKMDAILTDRQTQTDRQTDGRTDVGDNNTHSALGASGKNPFEAPGANESVYCIREKIATILLDIFSNNSV